MRISYSTYLCLKYFKRIIRKIRNLILRNPPNSVHHNGRKKAEQAAFAKILPMPLTHSHVLHERMYCSIFKKIQKIREFV